MDYDFSGYVTKNDIKCSDGRTIRKNAFAHCDGLTVPLVWNHMHNDPSNVLGNVRLENRPDGVYGYGKFNTSEHGQLAKSLVNHGDITSLSICANQLKQTSAKDVLHGQIREVSLVLAGANREAKVDNVILHDDLDGETIVYGIGEDDCDFTMLTHKDDDKKDKEGEEKMPQQPKQNDDRTVQDVLDSMDEDQKTVLYAMLGQLAEEAGIEVDDNGEIVKHSYYDEGDNDMKYNVFEGQATPQQNVLMHSEQEAIINLAKQPNVGSLKTALEYYADENELQHDALSEVGGFIQNGAGNVTTLFPEYKDVRPGAPELITNDQSWIGSYLGKLHKSPISRIRTSTVDIRNIDELRAKGFKKGQKKTLGGNFNLVRRTTDPTTVYVRNELHRDDIVDITDFDYVSYLYNIDRMSLNEELALATLIGDGRDEGSEDKIAEDKIRPIWTDDELYTIHVDIDIEGARKELQGTNTEANFGENYVLAEAMIQTILYSFEKYKGTGSPDLYCTPRTLNTMLLARDLNGRRIYNTKEELKTALNVNSINTVEQFINKTRTTTDNKTKKLLALLVNPADYALGATKGGEVTHFTDFDIDFNKQKSLLETRCSGALTRIYSAIAIEEDVTTPSAG